MKTLSRILVSTGLVVLSLQVIATEGLHKRPRMQRESIEVSDHYIFNTDIKVAGATILKRDFRRRIVTANVATHALTPNDAYSVWWAVFNHPQHCIQPYQCRVTDLEIFGGDPSVKVSVFYGGGLLADAGGNGATYLELTPGRTQRELFAQTKNYGLANLRGAEIHLVLRSHGPTGDGSIISVADQLGSAHLACNPVCTDGFASIHSRH